MNSLLRSKNARILTLVLLLQAGVFYGFSRGENLPFHRPLDQFSIPASNWMMQQDVQLDKDTLDVLKADDVLSRVYQNKNTGAMASLFIAYFQTQRTGKTPHSPKNCLPGTGWVPTQSGMIDISVPGQTDPIRVNRYVVARGSNQSLVLYWYQARDHVIASEYAAKIYTVSEAVRYNRTDTSLVRVVVGVQDGNVAAATKIAVSFVQSFFAPLKQYLPA